MSKAKRTNYLINPQFQLKLIGFVLTLVFLSCGIFYMSNLYFIWKFIEVGKELSLPENHSFFRFIAEQKRVMNSIFLITSLIITVLTVIGGLVLSHRAAGAMYRLETHMDEVGETGKLEEVNFRKNDFFSEIADAFNRMLIALRKKK